VNYCDLNCYFALVIRPLQSSHTCLLTHSARCQFHEYKVCPMGGACATNRQAPREGFLEGVVKDIARDGKTVRIFSTTGKFTIERQLEHPPTITRGDSVYCLVNSDRTVITALSSVVTAVAGQVSRPAAAGYYLFQPASGAVLVLPLTSLRTSFEVASKPVDCVLRRAGAKLELKIEHYNPFCYYVLEEATQKRLLARYRSDFEDTKKVNEQQLKHLRTQYAAFRRVRKDGNAVYRCVFAQFLEHLSRKTTPITELEDFLSQVDSKMSYFAMLQDYQVYADRVSSVLHKLHSLKSQGNCEELAALQWMLQDTSVDLALVNYLRLLVANFTALHYRSARLKRFIITDVRDVVSVILAFGQEAESVVKYVIPDLLKVVLVQQDVAVDCDQVFETFYAPEAQGRYPVLHLCKSSARAYHLLYSETQHSIDGYDFATHSYDLTAPSPALQKQSEALYRAIAPSSQHSVLV